MKVSLKIPENLHRLCKTHNCLSEVVVYYQLKMIEPSGYFKKSEIVDIMLKKGICFSKGSGYYKLKKLLSTTLVRETKNGYCLVSYDSLFSKMGYSLKYNKKRKRKGSFLIHKVQEINVSRVLSWIQYVDIRNNLKKQRINLYKQLRHNKNYTESLDHYTESSCSDFFENEFSKNTVANYKMFRDEIDCFLYNKLSYKRGVYKLKENLDITLSLKGVCRILGLTNVSSARNILLNLKKLFFINIESRLIETDTTHSNLFYKVIDGKRYANLTNKLTYLI